MKTRGARPAFRIALLLAAGCTATFYAAAYRDSVTQKCIFGITELEQGYIAREWSQAQAYLSKLDPPVAGDIHSVLPGDFTFVVKSCPFNCGDVTTRGCFDGAKAHIRLVPAPGVLKHEAQHAILSEVGDYRWSIIGHSEESDPISIQSAYNDHIHALLRGGRHEEAFDAAQAALKLGPDNPRTLDNLGIALVLRGDLEGAVSSFQKAIDFKPNDADFHNHLGVALQLLEREKEAAVEFAEAARLKQELSKQQVTDH